MGAGKRVRQFAERFGQGQLVQGKPRSECPEGGEQVDFYEFKGLKPHPSGGIKLRTRIEPAIYEVTAIRHDGMIFKWRIGTRGTGQIQVPRRHLGGLAGQKLKELKICDYVHEVHFPKAFILFGHQLQLDLDKKILRLDGKAIRISQIQKETPTRDLGPRLVVKTDLKDMNGATLAFKFYDSGTVGLLFGHSVKKIRELSVERNLVSIAYGTGEKKIPLEAHKLETNAEYKITFHVGERKEIVLTDELRKVFGFDSIEKLRADMRAGSVHLLVRFDHGRPARCGNLKLLTHVPEGASRVVSVIALPRHYSDEVTDKLVSLTNELERGIPKSELKNLIGDIGELLTNETLGSEILRRAAGETGVPIEYLRIEGPSARGPDFKITDTRTSRNVAIAEVKSTLDERRFDLRMLQAQNRLKYYFTSEWGRYRHTKSGLAIVVHYNPNEVLVSKRFKYNIESCSNPKYQLPEL